MKSTSSVLTFGSILLMFGLSSVPAIATTLEELVEKEEGLDLGKCLLSPKPQIAGESISLIIPARFENPHVWATHSILLVGLDKKNVVQGEMELKVPQEIYPKDVISADCKSSRLLVKVAGGKNGKPQTYTYDWDGKTLKPAVVKSKK